MREREEQQAELLDRYWLALERDPGALPPAELDPELAATAQQLVRNLRPPVPKMAFAARLGERLATEAATVTRQPNGRAPAGVIRWRRLHLIDHPSRWWSLAGLATAAVLVLVFAGLATWMLRPQTVSAQELLDKARAAAADAVAGGVRSFVLTEVTLSHPTARLKAEAGYTSEEQLRTETTRWYEAPNRWRIESKGTALGSDGQELPGKGWQRTTVSDGTDVWSYDVLRNAVQVNRLEPTMDGKGGVARFGQAASDLDTVLQRASTCGTPALKGSEPVAGRPAYVIDLGSSTCPSASAPEMNGPRVIWIDKETFFVLKVVQYSGLDGQLLSTTEVTSVQYNVPGDPARFTFTPPAGATVQDLRPKPAPAADQYQQQLAQLARQVDFPLFVPRNVPAGLVPLQPRLDDVAGPRVQLSYVPAGQAGTTAMAGPTGVRITQQKASSALVDRWTQQAQPAEPVTIAGGQGWLRRGVRDVKGPGTGSDSAAMVLRDGTLISVASFSVPPETLVEIAASLDPVPGSQPPLPNPAPPTLAGMRQRVSFAVFVPTWLPAGLTPEPPAGGEQPTQNVEIRYHTADGTVGFVVTNGGLDCCPGFAKLRSEPVTLPNGLEGHLIQTPTDRYGGPTLWWQQDGTTISLRGPAVGEADLVKVAAAMSKTADLGRTEAPPARPIPTPVPPPAFAILRPTWLPEPMTVRQQEVPNPNGPGSGVVLTFDPRPGDPPHAVLTLREFPKGQAQAEPVEDPQATQEQLGGRQVTIVRRGGGCVAASWVQGDVALTLTNPYDPPGPPGAVRYSCDQVRQIVGSIR